MGREFRNTHLIGIQGKQGSGKDTVAKLIQYHTHPDKHEISVEKWLDSYNHILPHFRPSYYEVVRFADDIKDEVCKIVGCTREQLEDREFKEIPIEKHYNLSPRNMFKLIGTHGREQIHPDIWVNSLFKRYEPQGRIIGMAYYDKFGKQTIVETSNPININYPAWLIPDVRYPNEAQAILDRNGINIRVYRDPKKVVFYRKSGKKTTMTYNSKYLMHRKVYSRMCTEQHHSENSLDDAEMHHYLVENNSSIESLSRKIEKILIKERVINET